MLVLCFLYLIFLISLDKYLHRLHISPLGMNNIKKEMGIKSCFYFLMNQFFSLHIKSSAVQLKDLNVKSRYNFKTFDFIFNKYLRSKTNSWNTLESVISSVITLTSYIVISMKNMDIFYILEAITSP